MGSSSISHPPTLLMKRPTKLASKAFGPWILIKQTGNIVTLQNPARNPPDNVKEFDVSRILALPFDSQKIVTHRFNNGNMQVLNVL
jgi:hypothetical protein